MSVNDRKSAMLQKHAKTLATLHLIIDNSAEELLEFQRQGELSEQQQARWKFAFGSKENITSLATKLVRAMHMLMPLERLVESERKDIEKKNEPEKISDNDLAIILRYEEKCAAAGVKSILDHDYGHN